MAEAPKKILIVEDETFLLDSLVRAFTAAGFVVRRAKDGEEGLAHAFAEHPDIILLDLLMPKLDGMSALKKLRDDPWGKEVAVIILTNASGAQKVNEAVENKVTDFLVKADWKLEEVVKRVKEKLGMKVPDRFLKAVP